MASKLNEDEKAKSKEIYSEIEEELKFQLEI